MAIANLTLRFITELLAIAALAYAGFQVSETTAVRISTAIAAPLALILAWAFVVAPEAANGLSQPQKDLIGTVLLLGAATTLGFGGQPRLAIVLGAVILANTVLLFVLGHDARRALEELGR